MAPETANILIVEDSPTLALTYREYMRPLGTGIHLAETGKEALTLIEETNPNIILLDLKLPDMDGIDILKEVKARGLAARIIVITAHGSVTTAVEAMQEGADDFLLKPFTAERITTTVKNALEMHRLSGLVEQFEGRKAKKFDKFIGESPAMQAVYRMIEDSAPSKASVFINGPSGTGKELCAEAIHQLSPRHSKHFVALNCAAIPENLIESEIFGHLRGAFTGATADREGAAVRADGGTLFLDEICEMPLDLQSKLLRFIQTGQVVPVGSNTPITVNVRFVCATNRNPWDEVEAGRFREDLFYRLHVVPIHVPPLKDRGEDSIAIAEHLLKTFAAEEQKQFEGIDTTAKDIILSHAWPGNVRELGNVIQSAVVLNDGKALTGDMLSKLMGPARQQKASPAGETILPGGRRQIVETQPEQEVASTTSSQNWINGTIEPLAVTERKIIERAIELCSGKVRQAAHKLEVNPSTLYRKLKEWDTSEN
ncbi:sigma-54-dependent transcriptional regulator [Kordiimonas laminariae]|uniref:sigma-54-dependent transcriptional regulator n=1 Tax=Kordiimonas laminariae TaxID=2917717 RepID=UPI001FF4E53E|nr:sigma-54 dependent transcriptional regulator [Kordiimonas laminariae]MCK0070083.1 sigma-54 dependent transcriptional regulator [Kordiimonas laminariae]